MKSDPALTAIVRAAQAGDPIAWSELVGRFQDFAVAVAVAQSGDWDHARDAAQEAFGSAFRHLDALAEPHAFPAWFATLVRTACNRRTRVRRVSAASLDGVDVVDPAQPDPATLVADAADRAHLRAIVDALPEAERAVIALHYLGGLSYPEVAAFLDIGVSAAKKRAFTARRRLEEMLMDPATLASARPSRTEQFRDSVLVFCAIRDHDLATLTRMLDRDPELVNATEDWSVDEALASGLIYAGRASALIRAAQTGDLEMVRLFVERGAPVADVCDCAGAESPLWVATVAGHADIVEYLLAAGADPNVAAFNGATPLHTAVQREHHHLVPALLAAGADPERADAFGRTANDWRAVRAVEPATPEPAGEMVTTGIRALDLFAPISRGDLMFWPPAYGLGQTVLLYAVAHALHPAEFWIVGFEHGPYSQNGYEHEFAETGVRASCRLVPAGDAGTRRAAFGRAVEECLAAPRPKFVQCLVAPGHAHDVTLALPALARDPEILATVVVEPFTGTYPEIAAEPPDGYSGQVGFDVTRALRNLWPAVDPTTTMTRHWPSERHREIATAARDVLADYKESDPDLDFAEAKSPAQKLLRYLAQPFRITEPFSSRPGESTPYEELLDTVESLLSASRK
ncbi:MAG: sigma-70 family RNA polymerase sigma factor [Acidimicrobiia bacterium]